MCRYMRTFGYWCVRMNICTHTHAHTHMLLSMLGGGDMLVSAETSKVSVYMCAYTHTYVYLRLYVCICTYTRVGRVRYTFN